MPNCKRHIIVLAFACFWSFGAMAQEFKKANELTYSLYQGEKWDDLIEAGDSILETGFNFYYLQLRVGLAYYFKKDFMAAIPYLLEAQQLNEAENIAPQHLYYCYFQTGQYLQALRVISRQNEFVQQDAGFNSKKYIQSFQVRSGLKKSNSEFIPKVIELDADLNFKVLKCSNLKLSVNSITQRGGFWDIMQRQFYWGYSMPLRSNWNVHLGMSLLSYEFEIKPFGTRILTEGNQVAASLDFNRFYLKNQFNIGLSTLVGDSTDHHQFELGYTYYPKGNSSAFFGVSLIGSAEENFTDFAFAFKPYLGINLGKKVKLTSSYLKGGGHNLLTYNGEVVNNNYDITSGLFEVGVQYQWHPKWSSSLYYNLELKENEIINDYHYNSLFINLKFTP